MTIKTYFSKLSQADLSMMLAGIIAKAMADGVCINFDYDGKNRTVEAHALGRSTKDGSLVMRGYQTDGEASRPVPGWSLFSLDKIEAIEIQYDGSDAPREGYKMGDKQMDPVLVEIDTTVS